VADDKYLSIYLNDHLAGSTVGLRLSRRVAHENQDTDYGEPLANLATEISEDRVTLRSLIKRLGIREDPLKALAPVVAEIAGRLKLNGSLIGYSPLSRVEELEFLTLGVAGKAALWRVLRDNLADDPRAAGFDFEALLKRATSQRQRLERLRARAAAEAFGDAGGRG
jgi:hypothetical protein